MDKIKPFEYWVQKTLPAVYDDSLSYYQLLAKIVHHLNTIGDTQNVVIDKVKELMNWFDNLDVQDEINAKLDEMAEDGTLDRIINHNIFNELNTQLAQTVKDVSILNKNALSVFSTGAKADGLTDDVNAIQQAIDTAHSLNINEVIIPDGTYYLNTMKRITNTVSTNLPIIFNLKSNVKITAHPNTRFIYGNNLVGLPILFYGVDVDNIEIRGFNIDGEMLLRNFVYIGRDDMSPQKENIYIHHNNIKNTSGSAINVMDYRPNIAGTTTGYKNVNVSHNTINTADGHGIVIRCSENVIVTNNIISNCYQINNNFGFGINISEGHRKAIVANNIINNCDSGVKVESWPDEAESFEAIIESNIFVGGEKTLTGGFRLIADNVVFSNNIIKDSIYYAVRINFGAGKRAIISGNSILTVRGSNSFGIEIHRTDDQNGEDREVIITNNRIEGCRAGIGCHSDNTFINGNYLVDLLYGVEINNDIPQVANANKPFDDITVVNNKTKNVTVLVRSPINSSINKGSSNLSLMGNVCDGRLIHASGCINLHVSANKAKGFTITPIDINRSSYVVQNNELVGADDNTNYFIQGGLNSEFVIMNNVFKNGSKYLTIPENCSDGVIKGNIAINITDDMVINSTDNIVEQGNIKLIS